MSSIVFSLPSALFALAYGLFGPKVSLSLFDQVTVEGLGSLPLTL
jgi:hypothetical protein